MSKPTTQRGNPRVVFRAPEEIMAEIEERQDALTAALGGGGDTPLGSTARRDLERYYQVVRDELRQLPLERGEVLLILDAMNGAIVDLTAMYRSALVLGVQDHIRLNAADQKWGVDGGALMAKLSTMSPGMLMALCDLAERFWSRPDEDTDELMREFGVRAWL